VVAFTPGNRWVIEVITPRTVSKQQRTFMNQRFEGLLQASISGNWTLPSSEFASPCVPCSADAIAAAKAEALARWPAKARLTVPAILEFVRGPHAPEIAETWLDQRMIKPG
jgi:hypothetical protein